jgi:hypothetical protein
MVVRTRLSGTHKNAILLAILHHKGKW